MATTLVTSGGTGNLPATNELPVDMWQKRMTAFPSLTPLTTILSRTAVDKAHNFQVDVIEENDIPTEVVVAQAYASAATTVYITQYWESLVDDSLLYNPRTFEMLRVNAAPTSNTITVAVAQGGTSSAAGLAGDVLYVLPPAIPEGDETFRSSTAADSQVYNYVQICKLGYKITRLMNRMSTHFGGPGSKRQQLKMQKYREFRKKEELLKYFGGRGTAGTTTDTTVQYMQGGLVHFLKDGTLYKDFGGVFTKSGFDSWIGSYYEQNPDAGPLIFAAAPNVIRQIWNFAEGQMRTSINEKKWGLPQIKTYQGQVNLDLVPLPLLKDPVTKGWGWILDMSRIKMKDVDRPTFYPDAKTVGESELIYDCYRSVTSMLVANETRHAMMVNALV